MVRRWQPYSLANSYVDFPALYLDIISKTSLFDKSFLLLLYLSFDNISIIRIL